MIRKIKTWFSSIIDWLLFRLLNDDQKKRLSNLFTERQKKMLRKLVGYSKHRQQKLYIKKIRDNLYSLGLREQALKQLKRILNETNDSFLKRLAAWELVLWHANLETKEGAEKALTYVPEAKIGENDVSQLRRIAIMEAECLARLGDIVEARKVINEQLTKIDHPDLYLALANLEENALDRIGYLNDIYKKYQLNEVTFSSSGDISYNELRMKQTREPVNSDIKVTVIVPAYNAGEGLRVAVESILKQTWQNLEVIIVDDCSTDNTLDIATEYAHRDHRVIVKQTPKNSGPYVARNIALEIATGDFVTVNDADDWSHEDKIRIQAEHLIQHPNVIANTSAHARLTEELYFYRRGTPGRYIFPNMSSIMFRRQEVMEKLGYWDSVRFSADGEFKRRLIRAFGEHAFVDLDTGPLSLPRQAAVSLTSGSPFGYSGFFKGARKEYVESFEHYYKKASHLYYPFPQKKRLFPVPEPMWPAREEKENGLRQFDLVIAADFRYVSDERMGLLRRLLLEYENKKIGFVQLYEYNLSLPLNLPFAIRELMIENNVQMLVYGEKIAMETLIILDSDLFMEEQTYIPEMHPEKVELSINDADEENKPQVLNKLKQMFGKEITVKPFHDFVHTETKRSTVSMSK